MGVSCGLMENKCSVNKLQFKKAVILKIKQNSSVINKNKKTVNNSHALLDNVLLNKLEALKKLK